MLKTGVKVTIPIKLSEHLYEKTYWAAYEIENVEKFYKEYHEAKKLAEENGYSNIKLEYDLDDKYGDLSCDFFLVGDREELLEEKLLRDKQEKQREAYERAEFDRLKRKFNGGKE